MMLRRTSPPKHRHDGTSPLPLGMDWSPPPKKWNGRDTIWPHDPSSGWSYCVTVPSWIALPKSQSSASDPVVFYRVQVGVQSPSGFTTIRGVLRRFNDFLKLFADLKKWFPKKSIPSAPPKGLLRMRSRALLEERRCSLEEWITKLLSDIDISRSVAVASFLELEAAARSSFLDADQQNAVATPSNSLGSSHEFHASSSAFVGSTSLQSDYGSDTMYDTSEVGTPSLGRDDSSDTGLEEPTLYEDMANPVDKLVKYGISNIEEGLLMGESILDQLEGRPRHSRSQTRPITENGNTSREETSLAVEGMDSLFEVEHCRTDGHARKPSNESIGSDLSSYRGSEVSNSWTSNAVGEANVGPSGGPVGSRAAEDHGGTDSQLNNGGAQIILPVDQRSKLYRILMIMQRRLITAKTDMEDMIIRLNQEVAVKDYLMTKVSDLEGELETMKQKSKENLQQALSIEKDRVTKMQWDMEEMRRRSMEMEMKLKAQEDLLRADPASAPFFQEKDELQQKLDAASEQLSTLLKQREELEVKSKSDIKVLVKEVKSLRKSQNGLQHQLKQSMLEKSAAEQLLQQEKQRNEEALIIKQRKLLHDCETLHAQLQECYTNSIKDSHLTTDLSTMDDALNLLAKSDDQITLLLTKVQGFVHQDPNLIIGSDDDNNGASSLHSSDDLRKLDDEFRKILGEIISQNGELRRRVNGLMRSALNTESGGKPLAINPEEIETPRVDETIGTQTLEA